MRVQHNIIPPLPGRGGNRKRKREEPEPTQPQHGADGYSTFRVDDHHGEHHFDDGRMSPFGDANGLVHHYPNGLGQRPISPDMSDDSDEEDNIPPYLLAMKDPETGLIMGRTPTMVKYILTKAKYEYAVSDSTVYRGLVRRSPAGEPRWLPYRGREFLGAHH